MSKAFDQLTATSVENQEQSIALLEKLVAVAKPDSVFGEPTRVEGRTIITASEVNVGLGVGFGFGGGTTPSRADREKRHRVRSSDPHARVELEEAVPEETETEGEDAGMGGGGGGGGGASGRPVAVISIAEDGVRVEPVVDATKIGLAFFTALGSMFFMLMKMRKAAERGS
ncbi:MAG: spore germination protein GerW family protein [Anaerolineae bacterium]|jgi:uncharacterized spore protein YtfJ